LEQHVKISSRKLTSCRVTEDGETVELDLADRSGAAVSVQLPFEQAEAIAMTLPHLLTRAVKKRTGSEEARYVFGLGEWSIEDTREGNCLIVTLKTADGFEVSFAIPFEACQALGWSLKHEAEVATETSAPAGGNARPQLC
jgi:hypothetical protein